MGGDGVFHHRDTESQRNTKGRFGREDARPSILSEAGGARLARPPRVEGPRCGRQQHRGCKAFSRWLVHTHPRGDLRFGSNAHPKAGPGTIRLLRKMWMKRASLVDSPDDFGRGAIKKLDYFVGAWTMDGEINRLGRSGPSMQQRAVWGKNTRTGFPQGKGNTHCWQFAGEGARATLLRGLLRGDQGMGDGVNR